MVNEVWQKVIDPDYVFTIAEAGVNHNGDMAVAKKLIDTAKDSGCDAVKFQSFKAEVMVSRVARKAAYQMTPSSQSETQLEMIRRLELSSAMHKELWNDCRQRGIIFSSSVFDEPSVDLLDEMEVPFFKIPSGEITNVPFLEYVAKKRRPVIMSTGMSTLKEVQEAVKVFSSSGQKDIALLHCVTSYPAPIEEVNLKVIETLREEFGLPVGFSDHTLGFDAALAAIGMGACIIEKHFTLDKGMDGPDHKASLNPEELREYVHKVRVIQRALGNGEKVPARCEAEIASVARKSVVAARDIDAGEKLTERNLTVKRPGTGISPVQWKSLMGKTAKVNIKQDQLITKEMLL